MDLFLVEQDLTNLYGEYLTEAVVAAPTSATAKKATVKMAKDWGLKVRSRGLVATRLGRLETELPSGTVRYAIGNCLFLAIGTGTDDDHSINLD